MVGHTIIQVDAILRADHGSAAFDGMFKAKGLQINHMKTGRAELKMLSKRSSFWLFPTGFGW